jgi:hypothetical protein
MNETDRRHAADDRLRRIIAELRAGRVVADLRTYLDEWAAYDVGGGLLTRGGRQRWFNNPCPWQEHERLSTYMDWRSPSAERILWRGRQRDPAVRKPRRGDVQPYRLIVDHAVPIAVIRAMLMANRGLWSVESITPFLRHHYKRGVLTKWGDDRRLDAAGLRQSMPHGWQPWDDPYARYRAVGIYRDQEPRPDRVVRQRGPLFTLLDALRGLTRKAA